MTSKNPEYTKEDLETRRVYFEGKEFPRSDVDYFRDLLTKKYEELLKSLERLDSFASHIQQNREIFPNVFLFDIAVCIAEASDMGESISAEEISKKLNVDKKTVTTKMPFLREIFRLLKLQMRSNFKADLNEERKRGCEIVKPVFHSLVKF